MSDDPYHLLTMRTDSPRISRLLKQLATEKPGDIAEMNLLLRRLLMLKKLHSLAALGWLLLSDCSGLERQHAA